MSASSTTRLGAKRTTPAGTRVFVSCETADDSLRRQYQACAWLPTKWDWIDPMKDASAEILQIEAGLKSRTQALAERGYDAEQVDREIAAERQRERALGLDFRRPGSPAQGVQSVPIEDDEAKPNNATDDAEDRPRPDEDQA